MTREKLFAFETPDQAMCPRCGSRVVSKPFFHLGKWGFFSIGYWIKLCGLRAVAHFHYQCYMCGTWHARATADMVSRLA